MTITFELTENEFTDSEKRTIRDALSISRNELENAIKK